MILKYNKTHDITNLNKELAELAFLKPLKGEKEIDGITPVCFIKSFGNNIEIITDIELTQEEIEQINIIIKNHDTKDSKLPTLEERIETLERELAEQKLIMKQAKLTK